MSTHAEPVRDDADDTTEYEPYPPPTERRAVAERHARGSLFLHEHARTHGRWKGFIRLFIIAFIVIAILVTLMAVTQNALQTESSAWMAEIGVFSTILVLLALDLALSWLIAASAYFHVIGWIISGAIVALVCFMLLGLATL